MMEMAPLHLLAELIDFLAEAQEDPIGTVPDGPNPIIINYGQKDINRKQIDQQILNDLAYAGFSLLLAAVMLRLGSGSTFMTLAGIFQIVVRSRCVLSTF